MITKGKSTLMDATEKVCEARYLANAIWMACTDLDRDECNALQTVAQLLIDKLHDAQAMMGEVEA